MVELITYTATRHRCTYCRRSFAHRATALKHLSRCFSNPAVRSCKTCQFFQASDCCGAPDVYACYTPGCLTGPHCIKDIDLETARCSMCGGLMHPDGSGECTCPGDGGKPIYGLRVHCPEWAA